MIRRPPRSTQSRSSAASDVYKRQILDVLGCRDKFSEFGQVRYTANAIEVAMTLDVVAQDDDVDRLVGRSEPENRVTDGDMFIEIEVLRLEIVHDFVDGGI